MVLGNPNSFVKDRHPLWRNFNNNKYEKTFQHGVVGPQWELPIGDDNRGFKHIASPMPKPEVNRKIFPNELPPVTYSPSSFDMPMRRDIVQVDIPEATIRTTEENIDPRFPPKRPVSTVTGTLYHGTGSTDVRISHGLPNFLEKKALNNARNKNKNKSVSKKNKSKKNKKSLNKSKSKKNKSKNKKCKKSRKSLKKSKSKKNRSKKNKYHLKNKRNSAQHRTKNTHKNKNHHKSHNKRHHKEACTPDPIVKQTANAKSEALAHAHEAENKASSMISSITNTPEGNNHIVMGVDLVNRYEQPDIKIHEHNRTLERKNAEIRNTPAGVRAAHTFSRLH
jgi:hypothetical protein